jgi:hypothetical protein
MQYLGIVYSILKVYLSIYFRRRIWVKCEERNVRREIKIPHFQDHLTYNFNEVKPFMSSVSVPCWELRSNIIRFAPNTTTTIDEFVLEEVVCGDLGILPGFQGGNKGKSIAGGVERTGSENTGKEEDVVRHDLLVCQPCDEDVEVFADGKTNSRGVGVDGVDGVNGQVAARLYEYDKEEMKKRPFRCKQRGCNYRAKERFMIKRHLADIHDIGVKWHPCPQEGCEYKAKQRSHIKEHLAYIHCIGVTWHPCPQEGCKYKTKQRSKIKTHLAYIHDIGVS